MRGWMILGVFALWGCSEPERTLIVDAGDDATAAMDGATACTTDRMCDDRIACTIDHCARGGCEHVACTDCCPAGLQCVAGFGCGRAPQSCTTDAECADGIRCTLDRCRDGRVCEHQPQEGLCESTEICLAAVGCVRRPPDHCAVDSDCNVTPCGGSWRCAPELGCQFRAATSCDDNDACTTDTCSDARGGCQHTPRDADGDGHGDQACGGDDCADDDRARHPGIPEVCGNSLDDNCDGRIDEGCCPTAMPCTTTCGSAGMTSCGPDGAPGPCVAPPETCNGRDDNCDGMIDNGFACARGSVTTCMTACGSMGTQTCSEACALGVCAPPMEVCNGRDDNCDGRTDEGCCSMTTPCTAACGTTGTTICNTTGMATGCRPPAETCNGRDDDCDGTPDNGFACVSGASGTCTTTCGSTGRRTCLGTCAWDVCVPPAETCNGRDDNCDGRTDEGCCSTTTPCTTTCNSTGTTLCNTSGMPTGCRPPVETCNGRDDDCDGTPDNGFACVSGATGTCTTTCGSTGRRTCLGSCAWDTCAPPAETCNGADDNCNGTCDDGFTCCARTTRACTALGFVSGTATCRTDCGGWDTSTCSNCGNRVREGTEQCDGADLGGATCATRGFGGGTLGCRTDCTYDTTACSNCGNGRLDTGEACDGTNLNGQTCTTLGMGFTGGTLSCSSACALVTTACTRPFNPTGTWLVSPGVNYYCAFGLVSFSFGNLSFNDTGSGLSVSGGGINCTMTGASARATRMVNVTCTLPGGCNETYTLRGTFTTDNTFTGTFTSTFTGSGCFDCMTGSFPVSGSR